MLAANKVDDQRVEAEAMNLWCLGIGEPFPVSAMHGRGTGDMLDAVLAALPEAPPERDRETGGPRRVAIVGKPNVGKSSPAEQGRRRGPRRRQRRRRDDGRPGGRAGHARRQGVAVHRHRRHPPQGARTAQGHEYYASLRTNAAIERAEVVVVVIDAREPMTEQDLRIMSAVEEAGKALVIAYNKWDLMDEERRY